MKWNGRTVPDEYVECRAHLHSYVFDGYFRHRDKIVGVRSCWRCGRELHTFFTKDMERIDTVAVVPEGYNITRTKEEREKGISYNRQEANKALLREQGLKGVYEE